jgi:hypothetical protein
MWIVRVWHNEVKRKSNWYAIKLQDEAYWASLFAMTQLMNKNMIFWKDEEGSQITTRAGKIDKYEFLDFFKNGQCNLSRCGSRILPRREEGTRNLILSTTYFYLKQKNSFPWFADFHFYDPMIFKNSQTNQKGSALMSILFYFLNDIAFIFRLSKNIICRKRKG